MSLASPLPPKQWTLGIISAKHMDDPELLPELIGDKLPAISHVYANGANPLVLAFAQENGIPYTVYPLTCRSLPWSNTQIATHSDFVFVIGTPDSKSAAQAVAECVKRGVKHRLISYNPYTHWQDKAFKIAEILAGIKPEDLAANPTLAAINGVL